MSLNNLDDVALACPVCTSPLSSSTETLQCLGCGKVYPIILGVPLLLNEGEWASVREISSTKAEKLLELLSLPRDAITTKTAAKILGGRLHHPSGYLSVESLQFVSRIKSSLPSIWPIELDTLLPPANNNKAIDVNEYNRISFEWTASYLPENLPAGTTLSVNFRLKNTGETVISSRGDRPVIASGHWITDTSVQETLRTKLLIDLPPSTELTFPILFHTPKKYGYYRFRPSLLIEGNAWIIGTQEFTTYVCLKKHNPKIFPQYPVISSYNEDHLAAIDLLKKWSREIGDSPLVVELGGNFSPTLKAIFHKFINVDIDLPGLQFAAIRNDGTINICADGLALPFSDGSIDMFGMFATLHHFPDPVKLLRCIKQKLKSNGRIALMCEPVGHVFRHNMNNEYLSELMKGVNEQSFSEGEYAAIFERSGFKARDVVIHGGSLKAWLEPIN